LSNKLILAPTLTLTLTDTAGAVLTLMLGYRKFKTKTGPNPNLWPCTFCSDRPSQLTQRKPRWQIQNKTVYRPLRGWWRWCKVLFTHPANIQSPILSVNWRHFHDLVLAKGQTKEVYCCDIVVLVVLFWGEVYSMTNDQWQHDHKITKWWPRMYDHWNYSM